MEPGDKVRSKRTTLAYYVGDHSGVVEKLDHGSVMVRMDQSGRLVPFRPDQLETESHSQYFNDKIYD